MTSDARTHLSRRDLLQHLAAGAAAASLSMLASCGRTDGQAGNGQGTRAVVVYTSVDDFLARPIARAASDACGIEIALVTDAEATKTTGLLQRLLAEQNAPKCDVWWSNEALATPGLASRGLLAPLPSEAVPSDLASDFASNLNTLPAPLANLRTQHWQGVALRSRVIAFSTSVFDGATAPRTLEELLLRVKPGRLAMAQPQFGTTRSFFAHLVATHGEAHARELCGRLKAAKVQLLPGNSAVVRAIAQGSADAGLTDSDDVFVGQREGWKVDFADAPPPTSSNAATTTLDDARLLIPCTVGLIAHPGEPAQSVRAARAAQVARALLSSQTETLLAQSEAVHRPVRTELAAQLGARDPRLLRIASGPIADWTAVQRATTASDAMLLQEFPV